MTASSAPGKIILFGEHAVVYGRPALAVPVTQVSARVEVAAARHPGIRIESDEVGLHSDLTDLPPCQPLRSAVEAVFHALEITPLPSLDIRISSTIPVAAGLGSGAAVSVALIRALSSYLGAALGTEQVNTLCYEIEKIHHGTPSGVDNTVISYARPVFFIRGQPLETFNVQSPFSLIIANTGIPALTKESVGDVRQLWQADSPRWEKVFDRVGEIVRQARQAIETGDWPALGPLMDANHRLLQEMTVSSPELDRLARAARAAGAGGAKLSGGGRGGNLIALVSPETQANVNAALLAAGAIQTIITTVT